MSQRSSHQFSGETNEVSVRHEGKAAYAFALVVHADLLERDDLVGASLLRHVDLPAGGGHGLSESRD
jgi:hypothetical protein